MKLDRDTARARRTVKAAQRNCSGHEKHGVRFTWAPGLRRCPWSVISQKALALVATWAKWKRVGVPEHLGALPAYVAEAFDVAEVASGEVS
jgi:hypothetical protein